MTDTGKPATDTCDLERQILDPNISKTEAEWWARNRIIELENKLISIGCDLTVENYSSELKI